MPEIPKPPPRLDPARAPRLRRIAALADEHARRSSTPAQARARRDLACAIRRRATQLETGHYDPAHDDEDEAMLLARVRKLGFGG